MSDRIAVINDGELAQVGTPRDIYNGPTSPFVASFIGESSFVPLTRDKAGALLYDGEKIAKGPTNKAPTNGGERNWSLVIRPERLSLQPPTARKTASKIQFHGHITELVYQGETAIVIIRLKDGQMLTARMNTRAGDDVDTLAIGQQLIVAIDKKDMIIIPDGAQ